MAHLPFYNKYPYTSFEQLNLDWLLEKVGGFDARITDNSNKIQALDERLTADEVVINELNSRLDVAEDDIKNIKDRLDDDENAIESLNSRMDNTESDISGIQERLEQAEIDIDGCEDRLDNLEPRVTTNEVNITALEARMDSADEAIQANTEHIDLLQNAIENLPEVIANPGGTGPALNTIMIGDSVYKIEGGGSGGGTSVTPNPAGEATGVLEKIDIDGSIFSMPGCGCGPRLDTLESAVSALDDNVSDLDDNKSNLLVTQRFTYHSLTLPKYSYGRYNMNIAKEGYTPLAVAGFDVGANRISMNRCELSAVTPNQVNFGLNNDYSAAETCTPVIDILFVKNGKVL